MAVKALGMFWNVKEGQLVCTWRKLDDVARARDSRLCNMKLDQNSAIDRGYAYDSHGEPVSVAGYGRIMSVNVNKHVIYSSQPLDLRASNVYLTNLSSTLDDYCVITATMPAGLIVPLHSHADRESFYVLSGEMNLYYDNSWRLLKHGDFVDVTTNIKHAWRNASNSSASLLLVTTVRMGRFLQQVSSSPDSTLDGEAAHAQKERFLSLVKEYGYWMGSPEENKAIGLSSDWQGADK